VQEVAFTLADVCLRSGRAGRGLRVDEFARSFLFSSMRTTICSKKSPSIARAPPVAKIMVETLPQRIASLMLRFTRKPPVFSLIRAAAGKQHRSRGHSGARSRSRRLPISAYQFVDEALALPTEDAASSLLRTQQILANETGVANTLTPSRVLP